MQNTLNALLMAIGRILMAAIFVHAGLSKIEGYAQTAAFMQAHGVPGLLLPLVILLELGGGLVLAFGLFTRFVATALALFSLAAIAIFVLPAETRTGIIILYAELAMAGGLLYVAAQGGGSLSIDHWRQRKRRRRSGGFAD
ncbi:inner membrane protein YqjF [mine drainage metagenome]|uniref:Inner membrane protein YqjF n=1 Tax=mine drainage metagenome TaxID=410659 RepID=A0A1J5QAD4_9ZZZZ